MNNALFIAEINPYVIVACEKAKYRSKVSFDLRDPEWNFATIFYRKHPLDYNVSVQVHVATSNARSSL